MFRMFKRVRNESRRSKQAAADEALLNELGVVTAKPCYCPASTTTAEEEEHVNPVTQPSIVDDDDDEDDDDEYADDEEDLLESESDSDDDDDDDDDDDEMEYDDTTYYEKEETTTNHRSSSNYTEEASESSEGAYLEQPARKRLRVDNKTCFPEFNDVPDLERASDASSSTSDEESVQQRHEEYAQTSQTTADVQVFLSLAARMSLASLLHLLQGAARAQLPAASPAMDEYSYLLAGSHQPRKCLKSSSSSEKADSNTAISSSPLSVIPKLKKFRFATVSGDRVRCVVHQVEPYKHETHLWWSNDEMMAIRYAQVRVVRHFRKHAPQFVASVTTLVQATEPAPVLEQHMKRLTEGAEAFARGLETHVVPCISERRKSHILAVLQEQDDCRGSGDSYDITSVCLREQSVAYSALLAKYAYRRAQCDQIDALKASMSTWEEPQEPNMEM